MTRTRVIRIYLVLARQFVEAVLGFAAVIGQVVHFLVARCRLFAVEYEDI